MLAPTTPAPTTIASGTALQSHRGAVEMGDVALYSRVSHGVGDLLVDVRVEGLGNEIRACGEFGQGFGGGELHLHVYLPGPGQERPAEDAGVAQDVVHARPVGGVRGARFDRRFGLYLGVRGGVRQDHLPHAHHLRLYQTRYAGRRYHHFRLLHYGLHAGDLYALLSRPLVARLVRIRGYDLGRLPVDHQRGDSEPGGAQTDLADHLVFEREPRVSTGDDNRRERHHGRAVHVVVHHRLGQGLYKASLD